MNPLSMVVNDQCFSIFSTLVPKEGSKRASQKNWEIEPSDWFVNSICINYIYYLVLCFNSASAILLPHSSGDKRPLVKVAFCLWIHWKYLPLSKACHVLYTIS